MKSKFEERLIEIAKKCDIEIKVEEALLFANYKREIEKWNERVNLTSIEGEDEFIIKHLIDSLILLKKIEIAPGARVIDVGTGAGFPGIPLKLKRKDLKVYLMDSNRKKAEFLENAIKNLGLKETYVLCGRAESLGKKPEYRENYDLVVARAVSSLNVLSEYCLPFARIGGLFVAMKGREPEKELVEARDAVEVLGGKIKEVVQYELPEGLQRSLILVEKVKETPEKYPRREGMPEKRPLR